MKLHPAQVATELKQYKVFNNFKDEILFQICTMIHEVTFKKGDVILKEGEKNSKLFILRKGVAEILLAGEVVAILQTPGDVMGEMSVVSQNEVSSTIRVASDLKCFVLDSEDFAHVHPKDKDHFQFLIHKIFSTILCDRLVKTNEKARLFEISNRELYQAQRRLETTVDKSALLVEPDKKQLVLAKMAVGCTGVHLDAVSTLDEGRKLLQTKKYDAVIVDENGVDLLSEVNSALPGADFIMMCSKSPKENLSFLFQNLNLKICITRDLEQRNLTTKLILATLGKVLNQDYFGIEKYLSWGVDVHTETLKASMQRLELNEKMKSYFKKVGVRSSILDRVFTVAEEIMMNAVYDAPVDSSGRPLFNHLTRKNDIVLDSHQFAKLSYACDGDSVAISVRDPFGSLRSKTVIEYLKSCYEGQAGSLNSEKGGAGRGLHQIVEGSDFTVFNLKKGYQTEVISLFSLDASRSGESTPRFHIFEVEENLAKSKPLHSKAS